MTRPPSKSPRGYIAQRRSGLSSELSGENRFTNCGEVRWEAWREEKEPWAADLAVIAAAQKVEHYEIVA